jgi:ABC-type antimicrobial peptide transport system permease subunit
MRDQLRELWRSVARDPSRLVGMLFGVVLGAAAIVFLGSALTTAGQALQRTAQHAAGQDVTHIQERNAGADGRAGAPLSERDMRPLAEFSGIAETDAAATSVLWGREAQSRGRTKPVGIRAGGTRYARVAGLLLKHGRWLGPEDEGKRHCLIGYDIFRELFDERWPLAHDDLVAEGVRFTVVGVLAPRPPIGGGGGDGTWMTDRQLLISNSTWRHTMKAGYDTMVVVMRHPSPEGELPDLRAIARDIVPYLTNLHGGVANFSLEALEQEAQLGELVITALGVVLYLCGLIAMLVGGINVMNAQLVAVAERTVEYGIRRALGLSKRSLMRSVLAESTVYTLAGSLLGVLLGIGATWGLSRGLEALDVLWPFQLSMGSLVGAVGSALVVGLCAGYWPARRASAIEPSECLRSS